MNGLKCWYKYILFIFKKKREKRYWLPTADELAQTGAFNCVPLDVLVAKILASPLAVISKV